MKRFILSFTLVMCLVAGVILSNTSLFGLFKGYKEISQKGYTGDAVYAGGNLGFVLEVQNDSSSTKYMCNSVVIGECISLDGGKKRLNEICDKLGVLVLDKYQVGDRYIIEGSSALLKYFIEGRQSNVQIAVEGDRITIGSPIIYGSY